MNWIPLVSAFFCAAIAEKSFMRRVAQVEQDYSHVLAVAGHAANRTSRRGCATHENSVHVRVVVVPSEFRGEDHRERLLAVQETWGRPGEYEFADGRCLIWDVAFANEGPVAYKVSHFQGFEKLNPLPDELIPPLELQPKGRAVSLVHNLLHEFKRSPSPDWVFKVDDCAFVLPENVASLFSSYDPTAPILLGGHLRTQPPPLGQTFPSAAGFALSRGAMKRIEGLLGESGQESYERLERSVGNSPDVGMGRMCRELGVEMPDTRDSKIGGERFNVFPPLASIRGAYHDWYQKFKQNVGQDVKSGVACCAIDAVLFHYVGAADIRFLQETLRGARTSTESVSARLPNWPPVGASLFDAWSPTLRPSPSGADPVWALLESIRGHLPRTVPQ